MTNWGPIGLPITSASAALALSLFGILRMAVRKPPPIAQQADFVAMARTSPVVLEMHPEVEGEGEQLINVR
jgi:hypothetical protein